MRWLTISWFDRLTMRFDRLSMKVRRAHRGAGAALNEAPHPEPVEGRGVWDAPWPAISWFDGLTMRVVGLGAELWASASP